MLALILLLATSGAAAGDRAIAAVFAEARIDGTFVAASLEGDRAVIHNQARAERRYTPASTFKILNTLIALEERVVADKSDVIRWDGTTYDLPAWNRDQTLESAFRVSCVWCFQGFARRVGAENYRTYIRSADYGRLAEPFRVDTFWLDGALTISAIEQVEFLKKVAWRSLPFGDDAYATLRDIMLDEQGEGYAIWAKTGWATRTGPPIGWYVGYVETTAGTWAFALNMEMGGESDLPRRKAIAMECLRAVGALP